METLEHKIVKSTLENRAMIIEEFCAAFMASKSDYFNKKGEVDFSRIELIEKLERDAEGAKMVYSIRLKPGKSKGIKVIKLNNGKEQTK